MKSNAGASLGLLWPMLAIMCFATGCAKRTPRPAWLDQVEYGDQCIEARRRALDSLPPSGYSGPVMLAIPLPPLPIPPTVRGKLASMKLSVDSAGHVIRSSFQVSGLTDGDYVTKLRRTMLDGLAFRPAQVGRCAVQGKYLLEYTFDR